PGGVWGFLWRRPGPYRSVRPEAGLDQTVRQAATGQLRASGHGDGQDGLHAALGLATQVQAARTIGPVGQRLVSRDRLLRRRVGHDPQLPSRWAEPRRRHLPDEYGKYSRRPAMPGIV